MGCTSSKPVISDVLEPGAKEFEMLKLTDDDICKLRRTFNEIVSPKEGTITVMTLLQYVETPVSMFADRAFAMFFCSSTRELDFRAFVLNVWNCCTFSRFNIELFLFDLYDINGCGLLSPDEVSTMFTEIGAMNRTVTNVHTLRATAALLERETIFTPALFLQFVDDYQSVLSPVFQWQRLLQQKLGGLAFWVQQTVRRQSLSAPYKFMSITNMLYSNHIVARARRSSEGVSVSSSLSSGTARQDIFNNKVFVDDSDDGNNSSESDIGPLTAVSPTPRRTFRLTIGPEAPSILDKYHDVGARKSGEPYRPPTPHASVRRRGKNFEDVVV